MIEQVLNVCQTTIVQDAWSRGQDVAVHGWVYSLENGRVRQLSIDVTGPEEVNGAYRTAIGSISSMD